MSRSGSSIAPSRTIVGSSAAALAGTAQLLHDGGHVARRAPLAVAVVARDVGGGRATAEALDRAKRDRTVARRLPGCDAELLLERIEHGLRVDESAADVRADLDGVGADGLEVEHVVEARDRHAVGGREPEGFADLHERLARQPAVLLLREAERRQDRRARLRVLLRDFFDLRLEAHRSVSPITASSEPTIAIRSAMSASWVHVAVASSATNDGARKCTRHGFGPPSDTR